MGGIRQVNTAMGRKDFHVGLGMPQGGREELLCHAFHIRLWYNRIAWSNT